MSSTVAKFIGIAIVIVLLVELVGNMVITQAKEEEKNPIDSDGMIKDGYSVSLEKQEEMEIKSYPILSDSKYNQNLLYTIGQCLFTAKELATYECIGNNVVDSFFKDSTLHGKSKEKGEYLYALFTKGNTITAFDYQQINAIDKSEVYQIDVSILESKAPYRFVLEMSNRKIQSISEETI